MLLLLYFAIFVTGSVTYAECEPGYYKDEEMCKPCLPNCTFCSSSDTCNQCNDSLFLSNYTCSPCPSGCKSCNSSQMCLTCKPGSRGRVSEDRCSDRCIYETCDKETGNCSCKTGYFGYSCIDKCPENCEACHSHSDCTVCKPGYYGETCTFQCPSGCFGRTCKKGSGNCTKCIDHFVGSKCDKCMPGRYGTLCENKCSFNCVTCNSSEYCSVCNVGFYGSSCLSNCPDGCLLNSCHRSSGTCDFGCKPDCTGPKCEVCKTTSIDDDSKCNHECGKSCPNNCHNKLCNQKGHCYSCINGYFGEQCTQNCPSNCFNGSCHMNGTCYSCIDGYYGNGCGLKCPQKCKRCFNEYCGTCYADDRKPLCQLNCNNCKLNQSCDFVTGQCDSCKDGFYGRFCNETCSKQCRSCKFSGDICTTCSIGWYGIHKDNQTYLCDKRCKENCFKRSCDALNGRCNVGCNTGFWGQYCENKCSHKCIDRACHKDNGTCSNTCMDGFYGPFCECPNHCDCSVRSMCDFNCSDTCQHLSCRRDNGVCINGCRNGRYDPECENEENGSSYTITGIVIVIVVVILSAVVGIVIVVYKRQNRQNNRNRSAATTEEIAMYCAMNMGQGEEDEQNPGPVCTNVDERNSAENMEKRLYVNIRSAMLEKRILNTTRNDCRRSLEAFLAEADSEEEEVRDPKKHLQMCEKDEQRNHVYGNALELQERKIPVCKLNEYVLNKTAEDLVEEYLSLPKGLIKSYDESQKDGNASKNRYAGIFPYDKNRVKVSYTDNDSDYINASYVDGHNKRRAYIACIGPTAKHMDNFVPFWKMVWQENVNTIVMLTNLMEFGMAKCDKYWPDPGHAEMYGDVVVACMEEKGSADFVVRKLILKKAQISTECHHIQFTSWQDKRVPNTVSSVVELQRLVRKYQTHSYGPLLVHCSAGIGRTGTFIALDILTNEGETDGLVDIYACVRNLREERVNLVQTFEQYCYLHEAVVAIFRNDTC